MADNNVKININVSDNKTVDKLIKGVERLNKELTRAQKLAQSIAMGAPTTAAAQSAMGGGTGARRPRVAAQGGGGGDLTDYGRGRAAIGTGAAGRDFAQQAQGLGGLVRVYATYAANLFAVSAAFNALKNAADTTNLVKGLEQLSVASGSNLPKVAKDLETAAGGAISFRDAMTATAQASSAGMTSDNIRRMGNVARQASQALGVDMSNALDRLSRGITKLEPELLDEIGIFTRLDPAAEEYARSIGKSVSALTSFEKRQAFANAVLAEGEQKFGAIALQVNPYNKLLATLKNVAQAGLELVNSVLGPLLKSLSESPTALLLVLGLIGKTLLTQAIPAITQWRGQLKDTADASSKWAAENAEFYKNYKSDYAGALGVHSSLLDRIAKNSIKASTSLNILSKATDNAAFLGFSDTFRLMNAEITKNEAGLNKFERSWLRLKGTMAIAAVSIGTVVNAFSNVLAGIGLVLGAISLLSAAFSENKDEADKSSASISNLKSSGENLDRVLESLEKRDPLQKLSIGSIAALSTALSELSSGILQAAKDTDATIAARGLIDNLINSLSSAIGKSDEQVLAKTVSKQLFKVLKAVQTSPDAAKIKESLISAMGLGAGATDENILKVFTGDLQRFAPLLDRLIQGFNTSAQSGKTFSSSLTELTKVFKDMSTEIIPKGKIVDALQLTTTAFSDLSKIMEGPLTVRLAAMQDLVKNPAALAAIPENLRTGIMRALPELQKVTESLDENQRIIDENISKIREYETELKILGGGGAGSKNAEVIAAKERLSSLTSIAQTAISTASSNVAQDRRIVDSWKTAFEEAIKGGLEANSKTIDILYKNAIAKAKIETEQAALSKIAPTSETIARTTELAKRQIDLDLANQTMQAQLILSQEKNSLALDKLTLEIQKNNIINTESGEVRRLMIQEVDKKIAQVDKTIGALSAIGPSGKPMSMTNLQSTYGLDAATAQRYALLSSGMSSTTAVARERKSVVELEGRIQEISLAYRNATQVWDRIAADATQKFEAVKSTLTEEELARAEGTFKGFIDEVNRIKGILGTTMTGQIESAAAAQTGLNTEAKANIAQRAIAAGGDISQQATTNKIITDRTALEKIITAEYERRQELQRQIFDQTSLEQEILNQSISSSQELLDLENSLGIISREEYKNRSNGLKLRSIEINSARELARLELEKAQKLAAIQKKIDVTPGGLEGMSSKQLKGILDDTDAINKYYDTAIRGVNNLKSAQLEGLDIQNQYGERLLEYSSQLSQAFEGMADAMLEWAKTGKWSAKEVFNSLIEGLVRYEMRLMAHEAWMKARPFVMKFLSSLFGSGTVGMGASPDGYATSSLGQTVQAKGGVWDSGYQKFAKGGAFTNSIVNTPTLFKFAKGTGLMGEAGPEAIMPLKRDSNGNLGVRSSQQKTEVVVNNYSGQPARAKETTDARGNRRIEVIVGDMTAGEVTRNGSSTNKAIRGTFGLQPQLIRR